MFTTCYRALHGLPPVWLLASSQPFFQDGGTGVSGSFRAPVSEWTVGQQWVGFMHIARPGRPQPSAAGALEAQHAAEAEAEAEGPV